MRFLARISLLFVALFLLFTIHSSLFTSAASAAGEFDTNYKVQYDVDEKGLTKVSQEITLRNKTSNFYADKFELKIGSTKVKDVKAQDITGPLETQARFENNVTVIGVKFNQKVIGIGKTLTWNLTYTSDELATKSGQIWEVSIPRLAKSPDITTYVATVSTPTAFGPIAFALPTPITSEKQISRQVFTFSEDQLVQSGISISFGEKQVFAFTLAYHLENNNLTNQTQEIPLPPDNNYQKIVLQTLDPAPLDVAVDRDNNYLARYKLSPGKKLDITASGYVEVFSKPTRNIYSVLSSSDKETYLQNQKYWEIDNSFIKNKAQELKTPQAIYNFVSTYLTYSEDRLKQQKIERKSIPAIIDNPKDSICTEFTDLFIAIARAAGIPAREVEGYAYTQNERLRPLSLALNLDVLHAWPEYWDDKLGWVQIDPTWGSTSGGLDYFNKLDFNHITFIQRGVSSQYPPPPGSYKSASAKGKDISMEFADNLPSASATPQLSLLAPANIIAGAPVRITAQIANIGNSAIIGSSLSISSQILKKILTIERPQENDNSINIPVLPPFARRDFPFTFTSGNFFSRSQDLIALSYAGAEVSKQVSILPIYSPIFLKSFLLSIAIAIIIISLGLLFYKKHRRRGKRVRL